MLQFLRENKFDYIIVKYYLADKTIKLTNLPCCIVLFRYSCY